MRLRQAPDKSRYLVSHILLRKALSLTADVEINPRYWQFSELANEKPRLSTVTGLPDLNFNLSHSGQLASVVISSNCPVGVDIEAINQFNNSNCNDVILAKGERRWLNSRSTASKEIDFVRLWTVKEAYVKLLGHGHGIDFSSFEVGLNPARIVRSQINRPYPFDVLISGYEVKFANVTYQLSLAAWRPQNTAVSLVTHIFDETFLERNSDISIKHNLGKKITEH